LVILAYNLLPIGYEMTKAGVYNVNTLRRQ